MNIIIIIILYYYINILKGELTAEETSLFGAAFISSLCTALNFFPFFRIVEIIK